MNWSAQSRSWAAPSPGPWILHKDSLRLSGKKSSPPQRGSGGTTKTHVYLTQNNGILSLQRKKENPTNIEFGEVTLSLQFIKNLVCLQYIECISRTNKEKNLEPMKKNATLEQTKNFLQQKLEADFTFFLHFNLD